MRVKEHKVTQVIVPTNKGVMGKKQLNKTAAVKTKHGQMEKRGG